jgi:hypothetical protein
MRRFECKSCLLIVNYFSANTQGLLRNWKANKDWKVLDAILRHLIASKMIRYTFAKRSLATISRSPLASAMPQRSRSIANASPIPSRAAQDPTPQSWNLYQRLAAD